MIINHVNKGANSLISLSCCLPMRSINLSKNKSPAISTININEHCWHKFNGVQMTHKKIDKLETLLNTMSHWKCEISSTLNPYVNIPHNSKWREKNRKQPNNKHDIKPNHFLFCYVLALALTKTRLIND